MSSPTLQRLARLSLVPGICIALALMAGAYANNEKDANNPSSASRIVDLGEQMSIGLGSRIASPGADGTGSPISGPGCPASSCAGGACTLTHSLDLDTDGENQVACATPDGNTTPNAWARCYNLVTEGVPPGENLTINSVTFGVAQATINGINIDIVLYLDCNDCPPVEPGLDATELARVSLTVDTADEGTMITVLFPSGPVVPADTDLIVEIVSVDDGSQEPLFAFRAMSNAGGQCAPSYIRTPDGSCGLAGWSDLADIGFPDSHLIQSVAATVGGVVTVECSGIPVECNPDAGPCGLPNGTPGCEDELCCAAVCEQDPICCILPWDQQCVNIAVDVIGCAEVPIPPYECVNPGPVNDCCTDPTIVFDGDLIPFDTTDANTDGVLDPSNPCNSAMEDAQIWKDVWYLFNANATGFLTTSVCFAPTNFDTKIAAYDVGTPDYDCNDIVDLLILCNEDCEPNAPFRSALTIPVKSGNTYLIRLGGYSPGANEENAEFGPGDVSFDLETPDLPPGFFLDPVEFDNALSAAGKDLKGFEDYPWEAAPNGVIGVDDPLDVSTEVPGWIQPGVLLDNVTYQSNLDPFGANGPNPRGGTGLALFTPGFIGATNTGLVANHFVDSLDILSGPPAGDNHTAMAMTIISFNNMSPGGTLTVTVYDKDDNVLGSATNLPAPVPSGLFLGLLFPGDATIGRVNLYDTTAGFDAEGVYDLTVYVLGEPDPCPWDLDGGGDVGVGDLLILLANWANPYGVPDLLQMLAAWGPCP